MHWLSRSILAFLAALCISACTSLGVSPQPTTMLIRHLFDREAVRANAALADRAPADVIARLDLAYDPSDPGVSLDLYLPPNHRTDTPPPVVVWVHGGAWVSGNKAYIANYLKLLAVQGYAVVGVGYTVAPQARYPTPVIQTNRALAWLDANAEQLGVDRSRIFLAGDSAGAQIAGQTANLITSPAYARDMGLTPAITPGQLRGVILYCGVFDASALSLEGALGGFIRSVMWSYLDRRDFDQDPRLAQMSVTDHMTRAFPPVFVSVGDKDPLAPQSQRLAETAGQLGVPVDALFFPPDQQAGLGHEYQFDLASDAGAQALSRSLAFLARRSRQD